MVSEVIVLRGPSHICYYFRWECNNRCLSCNNWMKKGYYELNLNEIKEMFSSPLFKDVIHVYLTGGEPFLNDKIVNICKILKNHLDVSISLNTNGFLPENVETFSRQIKSLGLNILSFDLSINGPEKIHDYTRGVSGGYKRLMQSHEVLEKLGIPHSWNFTIFKPTIPYLKWFKEVFLPNEIKTLAFGLSKKALGSPDETLFNFTKDELDLVYYQCRNKSLRDYLKYVKMGNTYFPSCKMGEYQIRIDPGGIAYLCDTDDFFKIGPMIDLSSEIFHHRVKSIKSICKNNCMMEYCLWNFNQLINNWRNRLLFKPAIYRQIAHSSSIYHKLRNRLK